MEININYFILTWTLLINYDLSDCVPVSGLATVKKTQTSTPPLPPLLFPQDPKTYRIVPPNETALKILQNSEKSTQTSLFPRERLFLDDPRREIFKVNSNMHVDDIPEVFPSDYAASLKSEVEEIQPEDKTKSKTELEEKFRSTSLNFQSNEIYPEDIELHNSNSKINNFHVTAILIAGISFICAIIYVGLLSWRCYLIKRYGMRERLVTHDEYCSSTEGRYE